MTMLKVSKADANRIVVGRLKNAYYEIEYVSEVVLGNSNTDYTADLKEVMSLLMNVIVSMENDNSE